MKKHSKEVTLR